MQGVMVPNGRAVFPRVSRPPYSPSFWGCQLTGAVLGTLTCCLGNCSEQFGVVTAVRTEPGCLSLASGAHRRPASTLVPEPFVGISKGLRPGSFCTARRKIYSDCHDTFICFKQLCVSERPRRPWMLMVRGAAMVGNSAFPGRGACSPAGPGDLHTAEQCPGLCPGCPQAVQGQHVASSSA